MRLLTWNLWWQFGPWRDRQPAILGELRAVDPDLALIQEVWADDEGDQAEILGAALGLHVARTRQPEGEPQRFGNAVLSRWPVQVLEQITLSGLGGEPSHRSALAVSVASPWGQWVVIVTHLAWQYDQSTLRQRQLGEIVELAARYRGDVEVDPPVILGGDFNAVPESDEIRRLTGLSAPYVDGLVFTDSWAAVGTGAGHTWTRQNPHAAEAVWPRRRLDYVFVSWPRSKPLGNPLSASLIGVEPRAGQVGSDHYGVLVELCTDRPQENS
jgi:endonuclease/exonuclease/phosphatase family metal-dependent hydrolase